MAYQRGRFGIEYRPDEPSEETPWLLWAIGIAVLLAVGYGSTAIYKRVICWIDEHPKVESQVCVAESGPLVGPVVLAPELKLRGDRPRRVSNLLMRLERAIATTNIALQVATIEEIRSLPGSPAADLDDALAQMLGPLKLHMLFGAGMRNEWVKFITVTHGISASRIAAEYGTTLKCLEKLNGDVSSLKAGQELKVMNHPQFRLSVYTKTGIADLYLNGRFFKRYYLQGKVSGANGSYRFAARIRDLLYDNGVKFTKSDLAELELLLPKGANMTIADFR